MVEFALIGINSDGPFPFNNIVLASVGPVQRSVTNIKVSYGLALIKAFPGTSFD